MVEMYKIALGKSDQKSENVKSLEILLEKSIMAAQPVNLISQLA